MAAPPEHADPAFVRGLLTSRAKPYPPSLTLTDKEVSAVMLLMSGASVGRADMGFADERSSAYVRLYDRGFIQPIPETLTPLHCKWAWCNNEVRYDATRMIAEAWGRAHLPHAFAEVNYGLMVHIGHREGHFRPEQLLATLAWHYEHTSVTSLSVLPAETTEPAELAAPVKAPSIRLIEHDRDGTSREYRVPRFDGPVDDLREAFLSIELRSEEGATHFGMQYDPQIPGEARLDALALSVILTRLADTPVEDWNLPEGWTDEPRAVAAGSVPAMDVDLERWRIYPHGIRPEASFSEQLPSALTSSLSFLDAPDLSSAGQFVHWAESSLSMSFMCSGKPEPDPGSRRRTHKIVGARKHTVRVDPHDGSTTSVVKTAAEADKVAASHTMWALLVPGIPNQCMLVPKTLDWFGDHRELGRRAWSSPQAAKRMYAIRTVMRAVQYLDAGLDLREAHYWLALNLPPRMAADLQAAISNGRLTEHDAHATFDQAASYTRNEPTTAQAQRLVDWLLLPNRDTVDQPRL